MEVYFYYNLVISGYIDNCGNDEVNLELLKVCVVVCFEYFKFKVIVVECMFYEGYGEIELIVINDISEGCWKNCCVVFDLYVL